MTGFEGFERSALRRCSARNVGVFRAKTEQQSLSLDCVRNASTKVAPR
jgi:hypothetical protein